MFCECDLSGKVAWSQAFFAPAKINLFLHVTGRRADGYHLLQTAFRFLDRGDVLRFAPRADGVIERVTDLPGVPPESDLCVRAARLLQQAAGPAFARCGVRITLEKVLPMGGGLGGGSSDAATVLLALNALWGVHFSRARLQALGLALGADVPVFVFGRSAFAQGVGEELQALAMPRAWYVVAEPPVQIATREIFASSRLTRAAEIIRMPDFSEGLPLERSGLRNDLQTVAIEMAPQVGQALKVLSALGPARMSGSGACVFAEFAQETQAREAQQRAAATLPQCRVWVAQGLDRHPLFEACADEA